MLSLSGRLSVNGHYEHRDQIGVCGTNFSAEALLDAAFMVSPIMEAIERVVGDKIYRQLPDAADKVIIDKALIDGGVTSSETRSCVIYYMTERIAKRMSDAK